MNELELTYEYWDCECADNFIRAVSETRCDACGAERDEQPPSRVNEVQAAGLPIVFARGTQIIYAPTHANGDTQHPDAEPGFVTSMNGDVAFCRYWSKSNPDQLRTIANSEATPVETLVVEDTRPQAVVDALLKTVR